jgi:hypothetical protein
VFKEIQSQPSVVSGSDRTYINATQIATDVNGNHWIIDPKNNVYSNFGSNWEVKGTSDMKAGNVPESALQCARDISIQRDEVWIINCETTNGVAMRFNEDTKKWYEEGQTSILNKHQLGT